MIGDNILFFYVWSIFYCSAFSGNDLARVLRWGPGYTGGEDPLNVLRDVIDAEEIKLDRLVKTLFPLLFSIISHRVLIASYTFRLQFNRPKHKLIYKTM